MRQPRARCPWSRDWSYCYTRARRPRTQVIGHTAHAGETPAHPGGRPTLVRRPRARCPRSQNALAPVMGHTAVCGRDARAPRRCENAHHSSTSGTSRNDRATPLFATERWRPALVGQPRARCPRSRDGSHCCMRARRPRTQAVRERAPFQRVKNTPERPSVIPAGMHLVDQDLASRGIRQ